MPSFEFSEKEFKALCNRELAFNEVLAIKLELEKMKPEMPRNERGRTYWQMSFNEMDLMQETDEFKKYLHELEQFQASDAGEMYPTVCNVFHEYEIRNELAKALVKFTNTIDYEQVQNDRILEIEAEEFASLGPLKKLSHKIAANTYNS